MPYYRRHLTYDEISPVIQKFRLWLRNNCPVVTEYQENGTEAFYLDENAAKVSLEDFKWQLYALQNGGYAQFIPYTTDRHIGLILINKTAEGPVQTVSPTHIRLPKLSHLICLTPADFFALFRVLNTAKNTQTGNSLMLNTAKAGIGSIEQSPLYPFFTKMRVNYRMNVDYADRKWTDRDHIKFLAELEPSRDNQLSAMQLLTSTQNNDILYFPVETVVQLELDWDQITDDYCIPPSALS